MFSLGRSDIHVGVYSSVDAAGAAQILAHQPGLIDVVPLDSIRHHSAAEVIVDSREDADCI